MDVMEKIRCANCFAELPAQGRCFSCGWLPSADRQKNALVEFTSLQNGRYTLGRVLGVGGFGITYAALDTQTGGAVAIKEYMPSALAERNGQDILPISGRETDFREGHERFNKEWQILSAMSNIKSIVRGLAFFNENRSSYIVMERLTGADIKALLKETAPQEVLPFCDMVIRNIGAALTEVHNRGIIHLDVSPANIFFQSDGSLRLIDFGSAMYINDPAQDTVQLKHGYAPPELYSFKAPKGSWTDVYALGATYYNLVSGLKVTPAETRLVSDDLVPLDRLGLGVPQHISDAIGRALSLDLNTRHKTVIEFLREFENQPPLAPEPPMHVPLRPAQRVNQPAAYSPPEYAPREKISGEERAAGFINKLGGLLNRATPKIVPPQVSQERFAASPVIVAQSQRFGTIRISMRPDTVYRIGRVAGPGLADFVVTDDSRVSKVHLTMRYDARSGRFMVTDLSTNGTFFPNGTRLARATEYGIYPNDTVCLASQECTIKVVLA